MKICILTPRFPFPENGGDVLRINNIARYLKSQGHQLLLVSFHDGHADADLAKSLYDKVFLVKRNKIVSALNSLLFLLRGKPIQCGYYFSRSFGKMFHRVVSIEKPDRYLSHLLRMAPYIEREGLNDKSVVEMTDALSKTYAMVTHAKGSSLKKIIYIVERRLIGKYERHVAEYFPKVVLVSRDDVNYFLKVNCPKQNSLSVHTNGVDIYPPNCDYSSGKICFVGNMRTLQNQDAALFFAKEVFPLIKKSRPDAKFYIIGAQPSNEITNLGEADSDIVVTGFVDDLYAQVKDSCVAVAPVRIAAGIQNKVLVAMAMGVPVVLSKLISSAIPELKDEENCFVRSDADEIAKSCIMLMNDKSLRNKISEAGRQTVVDNYSWPEKLKGYMDIGAEF